MSEISKNVKELKSIDTFIKSLRLFSTYTVKAVGGIAPNNYFVLKGGDTLIYSTRLLRELLNKYELVFIDKYGHLIIDLGR